MGDFSEMAYFLFAGIGAVIGLIFVAMVVFPLSLICFITRYVAHRSQAVRFMLALAAGQKKEGKNVLEADD